MKERSCTSCIRQHKLLNISCLKARGCILMLQERFYNQFLSEESPVSVQMFLCWIAANKKGNIVWIKKTTYSYFFWFFCWKRILSALLGIMFLKGTFMFCSLMEDSVQQLRQVWMLHALADTRSFYIFNAEHNALLSHNLYSEFHFLPLFLTLAWNIGLQKTACSKAATQCVTTK